MFEAYKFDQINPKMTELEQAEVSQFAPRKAYVIAKKVLFWGCYEICDCLKTLEITAKPNSEEEVVGIPFDSWVWDTFVPIDEVKRVFEVKEEWLDDALKVCSPKFERMFGGAEIFEKGLRYLNIKTLTRLLVEINNQHPSALEVQKYVDTLKEYLEPTIDYEKPIHKDVGNSRPAKTIKANMEV